MEQLIQNWINKELKETSIINSSSFVFMENNPIKPASHYIFCNFGWLKDNNVDA